MSTTKNDQKILIRSMNRDTAIKYMIDGDLNGKIEKNDENVWHLYSSSVHTNQILNLVVFITNDVIKNKCLFFSAVYGSDKNTYMTQVITTLIKKISNIDTIGNNYGSNFLGMINTETKKDQNSNYQLFPYPVFRPLFEYKE